MRRLEQAVEGLWFGPFTLFRRLAAWSLSPLAFLYCLVASSQFGLRRPKPQAVPVIGLGNLLVGGTGKTPVGIALTRMLPAPAVVMRGYGRQSQGTVVVSHGGQTLAGLEAAGDEATLYASKSPGTTVIVSESRQAGIDEAVRLGAKSIILDDAFHHREIAKYDILLKPAKEPANRFCLPAGPYRLPFGYYRFAGTVAKEGRDFVREVTLQSPTKRMLLVTAIANPTRLEAYLPPVVGKVFFRDHHPFSKEELETLLKTYDATSLLVTEKDRVKMEAFGIPLSLLALEVRIDKPLLKYVQISTTIQ